MLIGCLVGGSLFFIHQNSKYLALQLDVLMTSAQLQDTQSKLQTVQGQLQDSHNNLDTVIGQLLSSQDEVTALEANINKSTYNLAVTKRRLHDTELNLAITSTQLQDTGIELLNSQLTITSLRSELEEATFELGENMLVRPRSSSKFDCDDSALFMYHYFTSLDYDVDIVVGNLKMTGETFMESNHVWIWVTTPDGNEIPYDWGRVTIDDQHRAGYIVSYYDLLRYAMKDTL